MVCVKGEFLLEVVDWVGVFKEENLREEVSGCVWMGCQRMGLDERHVAVNVAEGLVVGCAGHMSSVFNLCRTQIRSLTSLTFLISNPTHNELGTYSSVRSLESVDPALCAAELVLRHDGLQDLECGIPELVVLGIKQHHEAGGLRVE